MCCQLALLGRRASHRGEGERLDEYLRDFGEDGPLDVSKGAAALGAQYAGQRTIPVYAVPSSRVERWTAMRDGHVDKEPIPAIDPALYWRDDMRAVLAARDIGALYRALTEAGLSQYQIARLTGQSQSEVSDILGGRRVIAYEVLERIAEGLGVPRELMGLSWWSPTGTCVRQDGTYSGEVTVADAPEGVSAEMLRRHVLALGATAAFGGPIKGIGAILDLPGPAPLPLPSRVFAVHVAQVRDLTRQLGETGKAHGAQPQVSSAATAWADRLLGLPGAESIKRALLTAVAELHIHAGWAASDAGLYRRAMYHYSLALELASDAGDAYLQAHALTLAGFATVEHGHPDDGLKMQQLAQVKAWQVPSDDPRGVAVQAWAKADSATAYAALGYGRAAYRVGGRTGVVATCPHGPHRRPGRCSRAPRSRTRTLGCCRTVRCVLGAAMGRAQPTRPHPVHYHPGHHPRPCW